MLSALVFFAAEPVLVERIVAVVDRQTITLSDVKRAGAVEIAKRAGAAATRQKWPEDFLEDMRKHLVQQTLLLDEAQRYSQVAPPDSDVEKALADLKRRFGDEKAFATFLAQCAMTIEDVRDHLRRDIRVDRFLELRIRSRLEVREQDLINYRVSRPDARQLPDDELARRVLEDLFIKKTLDYLRELAEKSDVRFIGKV